jgi:hypothetical protein
MNPNSDDMKDDYSDLFAKQTPVRGKYYEQAMRAKRLVQIDEDLLKVFSNANELNAALRSLVEASRHVNVRSSI